MKITKSIFGIKKISQLFMRNTIEYK